MLPIPVLLYISLTGIRRYWILSHVTKVVPILYLNYLVMEIDSEMDIWPKMSQLESSPKIFPSGTFLNLSISFTLEWLQMALCFKF